jgi:SH3 domain protein
MRRCVLISIGLGILFAALADAAAAAENGWVRGEIRLNIRTGPGTQFKIVGVAKTGDGVEILERQEGWTKIRLVAGSAKVKRGWIPKGYLNPTPPPTLRLARAEEEVGQLNAELEALRLEAQALREKEATLTLADSAQTATIQELTQENMKLHAGDRYPEWITGASILAAGMLLGSLIYRSSTRRQQTRIRL